MVGIYFDLVLNNFGPVIENFTMLEMTQAYVHMINRQEENYHRLNPPQDKTGKIIKIHYPFRKKT